MLGFEGSLEADAAQAAPPSLQPFEQAGANFPGSAFYYLDRSSGVVAPKADVTDPRAPLEAGLGAAIARPTFLAGSAEDRFRALHCLTTAIYYEAATEPDAGQRAVAQVVLNRVAHPQWPDSVCGVVYQGSERPGCQFSFACDGSMARAPVRMWWQRARAVAERALAGDVYAPVGLATYYHTGAVHPAWADRMTYLGAIGAHLFYRPPGAGGLAAAFTDRYRGGEPSPGPRPRAVIPTGDPLAEAVALAGRSGVPTSTRTAPGPAPTPVPQAVTATPDSLPSAGQVRPEYRNSGRWIATPGG
ncbi:MAG: cell wall hydrolase [Novosphingobium sp.]|nr:cell wall hydrolase [Novosphingobium sp.]